ncbi:DinB family protein [Nocardioides montaniterrae]
MTITPDTKDWTWVLDRPCGECGFDPAPVGRDAIAQAIRDNAAFWQHALTLAGVEERPAPATWSPTEYACHVRDVHRIFGSRLALMLDQDDPQFANWDQDETAAAERYDLQRAEVVAVELAEAARSVAAAYDEVRGDQWGRRGRRSNGSVFTVETLGRYHLHDVIHHRWDVGSVVG